MFFLKKIKRIKIADRLIEEKLYEQVLREMESGFLRNGLWAKAFQKSHGDEQKAKALYFKYRIQSIKDEPEIFGVFSTQREAVRSKTEVNQNFTNNNEKQISIDTEHINPQKCEKPIIEKIDKASEKESSGRSGEFFLARIITLFMLILPIIIFFYWVIGLS